MNTVNILEGVVVIFVFAVVFILGMFTQYTFSTRDLRDTCIKQNAHLPYKDVQKLCVENIN